jgi:hypothetical protein
MNGILLKNLGCTFLHRGLSILRGENFISALSGLQAVSTQTQIAFRQQRQRSDQYIFPSTPLHSIHFTHGNPFHLEANISATRFQQREYVSLSARLGNAMVIKLRKYG